MKLLMSFIVIFSFCVSGAFANCKLRDKPEPPSVPTGSSATLQEMTVARENIQSYVHKAENHINCIYNNIGHDYALRQLRAVVRNFNRQLKIFKLRQGSLANNNTDL